MFCESLVQITTDTKHASNPHEFMSTTTHLICPGFSLSLLPAPVKGQCCICG